MGQYLARSEYKFYLGRIIAQRKGAFTRLYITQEPNLFQKRIELN